MEEIKYKRLLETLKRSTPELKGQEIIEKNVMRRIRLKQSKTYLIKDVVENLFAWGYVGWVRKSLVTASVLLLLFFAYQQTMILKEVNSISKRTILTGNSTISLQEADLEKQLKMLRFPGSWITAGRVEIPREQLEELLDSYNELQEKYSDLVRMIGEDPDLKKYIEMKLDERKKDLTNL